MLAILMLHASVSGVYAQTPEFFVLKGGTNVPVQLTSDAGSEKRNTVTAMVAANVVDHQTNEVLIAHGTPVQLNIDKQKAKGMGKGGYITIKTVSTMSVDGSIVMLNGSMSQEGDDTDAALITGLVTGLTVLPVVGFAFFALKGKKVTIPSGTIIMGVTVADNYNVAK